MPAGVVSVFCAGERFGRRNKADACDLDGLVACDEKQLVTGGGKHCAEREVSRLRNQNSFQNGWLNRISGRHTGEAEPDGDYAK